MEENGYDSKSEAEEEKPKAKNGAFKRFQMSDRELDDYVEADSRMDAMAERMNAERPGYMDEYERNPEERERVRESALMHVRQERDELNKYVNHQPYQGTIKDESKEGKAIKRRFRKAGFKKLMRRYTGDDPSLYYRAPPEKIDVWPPVDAKPWGHLPWRDPIESSPEDPYTQDDLDSELPMRQPVLPDLYHDKLVPPQEVDMIARALELRERGNEAYKNDDLNDAVDQYTYAAESLEAEAGLDGGGMLFVSAGEIERVAFVLSGKKKPDVGMRDFGGNNLVALAVEGDRRVVLELLLDAGAAADNVDYVGHTPLMLAALHDRVECGYRCAVAAPAALDTQGRRDGRTALHMACRHGHAKMTKLLVDAGARVDLTDFRALTARDLACQYHHGACVDIIDDRPDILPDVDDDYLYNLIPERAVELMSPTRGVAPFFFGDHRVLGPRTSSTTGCSRRSCTAARTRSPSSRNRSTGRGSGAATRSRTRTRRTCGRWASAATTSTA